jgi:hypothetical protein
MVSQHHTAEWGGPDRRKLNHSHTCEGRSHQLAVQAAHLAMLDKMMNLSRTIKKPTSNQILLFHQRVPTAVKGSCTYLLSSSKFDCKPKGLRVAFPLAQHPGGRLLWLFN